MGEEISKQSVEDLFFSYFFLVKCEERDKLKELLNKKDSELEGLENSQPIHTAAKNDKALIDLGIFIGT